MRLHQLRIEAFGPFGEPVEVDFEPLNEAGQFLISGATGSGKTSILDAVCFALYGQVPGERQRAKHLRSDYAAPGAEPRVTLTLTVAERLIRIARSPAWERPKRRGDGTTTQQASVRLEQQINGTWQVLATRLDEAGHLINTWLGMTPVQFTQVALLPQGGFQTFLHSPTAERQAILQRLFRTDRFERVETWFADFRRSLNRARAEAWHGLDLLAHRLAEAASNGQPPVTEGDIDALEAWASGQRVETRRAAEAAISARDDAAFEHDEAVRALTEASELADVLDRAEEAEKQLRSLEESEARFAQQVALLRAHERAHSLVPLLQAHADAREDAGRAEQAATRAFAALGLATLTSDELLAVSSRSADEVAHAERAQSLSAALDAAIEEQQVAQLRKEKADIELAELRAVTAAIPERLAAVADNLRAAGEAEVALASSTAEVDVTRRGLQASLELDQVRAEHRAKSDLRRHCQEQVHALRQQYLDVREARIEAMASELASGLVVGCSCPVCGSTAHPSPAAKTGNVGRKAEERARRAYESAGVELSALDEMIAGYQARIAVLARPALERSPDEWGAALDLIEQRHDALSSLAAELPQHRRAEGDLKAQWATAQSDLERMVRIEAQADAQLEVATTRVGELQTALASVLGDYPDAVALREHALDQSAKVSTATTAWETLRSASQVADQHRQTLDQQALSLGFASGASAEAAILEQEEAEEIGRVEQERDSIRRTACSFLDDPAISARRQQPYPDLGALRLHAAETEATLTAAEAARQIADRRCQRTQVIAGELTVAARNYRPLEAKAEQVTALSALLEGTGADNRMRMRLSAFVLAERLRQVIAAANARLEVISEGRYVLNYQEERGAGDRRGGLSLAVLDEWTGIRRDPTTLSGGETFVVSLCLALGLADTVADESGGLRIDTLFIDEGFGSLDFQTLDSVIDILGQLSEGGRVTGVVSHVQELRERLPAVLEVVPSKSGSTVRRAVT